MEDHKENSKAKTHKGRLYLESKESKALELPKECLFLNTNNSSEIMRLILTDLVRNKSLTFSIYQEGITPKSFQKKTIFPAYLQIPTILNSYQKEIIPHYLPILQIPKNVQ